MKYTTLKNPNNRALHLADYFFFLRPMLHPPVWTIVLLGYFSLAPHFTSRLGWLLIISSAAASWAYILNQIADIESDRINKKLFFLPENIISLNSARLIAVLSFVAAVAGGFALGAQIGILFLLGLSLGQAYSMPPFSFKSRPFMGLFCNAIAHGTMPFMAGFIVAGGEVSEGFFCSLPYFSAVGAVFIGTTIPDFEGDRATGKTTPAVFLGPKLASVVMTLCAITALALSLILRDIPMLLAASFSLPFYIYSILKNTIRNASLSVKASILSLSLAAAWYFPAYLLLIIVLTALTRIYYRRRFDMAYPSLT